MSCNSGRLSEQGKAFLKHLERFKPDFYDDAGNEAIGYGINCKWRLGLCNEYRGKTPLTQAQGEEMLNRVTPEYEAGVRRLPNSHLLNQNQFDGFVVIGFNTGIDALSRRIEEPMRRGDFTAVAEMIPNLLVTGRNNLKLHNRRQQEYEYFTRPMPETSGFSSAGSAPPPPPPPPPGGESFGPDPSFQDHSSEPEETPEFRNPNTGVDPRVRAHAPNLIGAAQNIADCFQEGEYFMGTWNAIAFGFSTVMLCATGGVCTVTVQAPVDGAGPPRLGFSIAGLFGVGN